MKDLKKNIISMIESCENEEQIKSCEELVKTFKKKMPFLDMHDINKLIKDKNIQINDKDIVMSFCGKEIYNCLMVHCDLEKDQFSMEHKDMFVHDFEEFINKKFLIDKIKEVDYIYVEGEELEILLHKCLQKNILENNIDIIESKIMKQCIDKFTKRVFELFRNVEYINMLKLSDDFSYNSKIVYLKGKIHRYNVKTVNVDLLSDYIENIEDYQAIDIQSLNNILKSCRDKPNIVLDSYVNKINKIKTTNDYDKKVKDIIIEAINLHRLEV